MFSKVSATSFLYRHLMRCGGLVVLLVVVSCSLPTKRNPDACCTTQADCDAVGLPVGSDCSEGQCIGNQCVVPTSCQANSDCSAPTSICDVPNGTCVQCLDSSVCSDPLLACGSDHTCVECVDNSTCGDRVCDGTTNVCRGCANDNECSTGFCATDTMKCVTAIVPRFLPNVCDTPATSPQLVFLGDTGLNTGDDATCNGGVVQQSSGPDICVLRYDTITIGASVTVSVGGSRALALVADHTFAVDGILDVSAVGRASGPGGGTLASGGAPAFGGGAGGGGAGFQTPGAPGGNTASDAGASNGGAAVSPQALQGGPRATAFGFGGGAATGGGGGGAATLISCRADVSVTGLIAAGGGGGTGGITNKDIMNLQFTGGAGGGAGGYVAIQARRVSLTGQFYANGGGGGGGLPGGAIGSDADRSTSPAAGGSNANGGSGGAGGALALPPTAGRKAQVTTPSSGGGGGGSVGFFETYTPAGEIPNVSPSASSPAFSSNGTIQTR